MDESKLYLTSLQFSGFRGFTEIDLRMHKQLNVLSGINGAGKSTVLDGIACIIRNVIQIIKTGENPDYELPELDIKNENSFASITAFFSGEVPLGISGKRSGHKIPEGSLSDFRFENGYIDRLRQSITDTNENCNIPVFAYYPVNRAVIDIPLRIRQEHRFELLETYLDAMDGAANFRHFFEWFRNREDLENEEYKESRAQVSLFAAEKKNSAYEGDSQLNAVRHALRELLPDFSRFSIGRNPLRFEAKKNGKPCRIDQLSDGEKCMIAMIGDLARRIAIANPVRENPLEGEGIVLIDEIELHLHPAWQRMIVPGLLRVFPNVQFIITTHSPQVLGEVDPECVRLLYRDEQGESRVFSPEQTRGLTSGEILDFVMKPVSYNGLLSRSTGDLEKFDQLYQLIDDGKFPEAEILIGKMEESFHGEVPELIRAKSILKMYKN